MKWQMWLALPWVAFVVGHMSLWLYLRLWPQKGNSDHDIANSMLGLIVAGLLGLAAAYWVNQWVPGRVSQGVLVGVNMLVYAALFGYWWQAQQREVVVNERARIEVEYRAVQPGEYTVRLASGEEDLLESEAGRVVLRPRLFHEPALALLYQGEGGVVRRYWFGIQTEEVAGVWSEWLRPAQRRDWDEDPGISLRWRWLVR